MNEKIKTFFACIGGFFSAAVAVLVGIFIGRRNNNADGGAMGKVQAELDKTATECERIENYQSESRNIIEECKSIVRDSQSIIAEVERRNSQRKN